MDANKMQCIRKWRHPRTLNDVQCFLGLYTAPLLGCVRNSCLLEWTPLLDKCFESIKTLACKAPTLKPIDHNNPDPIWVITDGSKAGVGAVYGQGPDWKTC